jgi:UDP-N-acetylmuramyl pentapeptide phosphotransferase/UDP-N-acetylglucosamine-1-phosphate transferase
MSAIITLLATSYLAFKFGDVSTLHISLLVTAAIIGFFIWNYPNGLIFLGDGGAYLVGFLVSLMLIYLSTNSPQISKFSILSLVMYPVIETLFSIFRKILKGKSPLFPDGNHLHTLSHVYFKNKPNSYFSTRFNSNISPFIWVIIIFCIWPAVLFPSNPYSSLSSFTFFIFAYTLTYIFLYLKKT